jgi:hypothetical protein
VNEGYEGNRERERPEVVAGTCRRSSVQTAEVTRGVRRFVSPLNQGRFGGRVLKPSAKPPTFASTQIVQRATRRNMK